jgi:hypothetical protein
MATMKLKRSDLDLDTKSNNLLFTIPNSKSPDTQISLNKAGPDSAGSRTQPELTWVYLAVFIPLGVHIQMFATEI